MNEKEKHILEWIKNISKSRPELNGFAICPFASQAKFKIIECSAEEIIPIEGYEVIIYIIEDYLDLNGVQFWVDFYNSTYNGWKFFEDCWSYDTYIKDLKTNNGKYNLIIAQPTEKLKKFREKLAKTEYYSFWDKEYYDEIMS